jgi:BirA family biotin operon repressor/biotin-[acetyl-CoA-carboxylase] ligase
LLWRFNLASSVLSGLGIVIAVAVDRALSAYSYGLKIKWPNDILHEGKKLAGILLEMQAEANGPAYVAVGVGINVRMPTDLAQPIDQPWTDLYRMTGKTVSRNALAASLIKQLIQAIQEFEKDGLANFISAWQERDMLLNQQVEISLANKHIQGIACGIDASGALQVQVDGLVKSFMAGEASLKKSAGIA